MYGHLAGDGAVVLMLAQALRPVMSRSLLLPARFLVVSLLGWLFVAFDGFEVFVLYEGLIAIVVPNGFVDIMES